MSGTGGPLLEELVAVEVGRLPGVWAARTRREVPRLARFLALLLEANEEINLLSAADALPGRLVERHLGESLQGLLHLPEAPSGRPLRLLDIGSGGGFPAVPLLLVRGDIEGVLVESTSKKKRFLERAASELGLTVEVANDRFPAPFLERMKKKNAFDVLTTRAVAAAGSLVRRARPVLAPGARALLWTTRDLFRGALRESGFHRGTFVPTPGSDRRGIAVVECST